MPDLVPIKVIIRKGVVNGQRRAIYPNFNSLPAAVRNNQPWSTFVDSEGIGWHYDKIANIGTGAETGTCCTLVPKAFADAAIAAFPADVSKMTEAEFTTFHDDRAHAHEPEDFEDLDTLQALAAREALGQVIPPAEKAAALDRDNPRRGVRRNRRKHFADVKADRGITVIQ